MEIEILNFLRNNEELKNLIGENRFFPIFATDISKPALEYQFRDIRGGIVKQSQLSINVIWSNYDFILKIVEVLNSILDFKLSTEFITVDNIQFNSMISGGSTPLYRQDLKLYQKNLNYLINWRTI